MTSSRSSIKALWLIGVLAAIAVLTSIPFETEAVEEFFGRGREIQNPLRTEKFEEVITRFANFGAAIAGALMTLVVLYAGYLYLFSGGSEEMLKRARKALTWAVVGFIVILLARGAAELIKNILGTR